MVAVLCLALEPARLSMSAEGRGALPKTGAGLIHFLGP